MIQTGSDSDPDRERRFDEGSDALNGRRMRMVLDGRRMRMASGLHARRTGVAPPDFTRDALESRIILHARLCFCD